MLQFNLLVKDDLEAVTLSPRLGMMSNDDDNYQKKKGTEGGNGEGREKQKPRTISFTLKAGNLEVAACKLIICLKTAWKTLLSLCFRRQVVVNNSNQ